MAAPTKIRFDASHKDDLSLVRHVLLRRLREDKEWRTFGQTQDAFLLYLDFDRYEDRMRFDDLLRQVIWELVTTGVIVPGNALNPGGANLPWFTLTNYGHQVLEAREIIPHDPDGYLSALRQIGKTCLNDVSLGYVGEALNCFARACYTASVLLLGVAAEGVILNVCELVLKESTDPAAQKSYRRAGDSVKRKHRWLVDQYTSSLPRIPRGILPDGLNMSLTAAYELIRQERNDLGHPNLPPSTDRGHAFSFFMIFETMVHDLEAFVTYLAKA